MEVWKIRHKQTGLYSMGGRMGRPRGFNRGSPQICEKRWNEQGKSWNRLGHVKSHITNNMEYYRQFGNDMEIVKLVLKISPKDTLGMSDFVGEMLTKKQRREAERERSNKEARIARLRAEQERLEQELNQLQ